MDEIQLYTNWNDIVCPICLDYPHNSVLLQCSSHDKGCHPFVCDTDHLHSNCLERFKQAHKVISGSHSESSSDVNSVESLDPTDSEPKAICPLCRGDVTGWIIIDKVRNYLNEKKRSCDEAKCKFEGEYKELRKHALIEHPQSCPSKIDPARLLDWENFQQSSEIIDVLSTIHAEVPRGVVLGDYVIEYGDENSQDEYDDFPGDERRWWSSCILYTVFDNFRASRNRRRARVSDARRVINNNIINNNRTLSYDASNSDESSVTSVEFNDYRLDDNDDDLVNARGLSRARERSYRRRRSRFYDN